MISSPQRRLDEIVRPGDGGGQNQKQDFRSVPGLSADDGERQAEASRGHRHRARAGWLRLGHRLHHIGSLSRAGQTGCVDNAWLTTQPSRLSGMHGGGREPVRGNPRQSLWNLDFRLKTEAGQRRTMVLR